METTTEIQAEPAAAAPVDITPTAEVNASIEAPSAEAPVEKAETPVVKKAPRKAKPAKKAPSKAKPAKKVAAAAKKTKRAAGVKAQGQVAKEAFRLLKAFAREKGIKPAEAVRIAVHKLVGFKEA